MSAPKSAMKAPTFAMIIRHPVMFLGFGFGSGLIAKGPGTLGTLVGMLVFIPILLWNELAAWGLFLFSLLVGSYVCGESARRIGVHDHGGIVWDEFAGVWLVILTLPEQGWLYWGLAFILFRVFDIAKPWPISWADQKVAGGVGIMLDDIIAACYAIIIIWALQTGFL